MGKCSAFDLRGWERPGKKLSSPRWFESERHLYVMPHAGACAALPQCSRRIRIIKLKNWKGPKSPNCLQSPSSPFAAVPARGPFCCFLLASWDIRLTTLKSLLTHGIQLAHTLLMRALLERLSYTCEKLTKNHPCRACKVLPRNVSKEINEWMNQHIIFLSMSGSKEIK